ncbi:polysaccharide export protein (CAP59), putative [Galdieria sulphuraria]|uniref:Polysaccharide export protein (CAP59), putative n=1 Tax=Galdieria sulphuraria TaxID=130081 RepID=M2XZ52_GALSU|nr:polysaccharide export protein (CAP59), putative [Galdieria sulphuraria]EME28839.1 polysaccharide export protein (CAP59), putative [Galdieria sulphuraria]|eukprot:XP_005705359.1 polysaccharide export protein (CAP59), putative [Galdieria sulphuraria]
MNSEDIFPHFSYEIVNLAKMLEKAGNTFISIYENGSRDKTKKWLRLLSKTLLEKNIAYRIVCDSAVFSNHIDAINRLALVRDRALTPLFLLHSYNQLHNHTKVIFLNDIYLDSLAIYRLVKTRAENYDWVCGLDFYRGFYDRFVSRDIHGRILSRWYPYIREEKTKRLLIQQLPVPVRSCWNGAAVFCAQPLIQYNLTFLGSLKNQKDSRCANPRSECHMLALSFRKYNYTSMWINPNILISYDSTHLKLQQLIQQHFRPFFGLFNDILMKWFQKPWLEDEDACPRLPMLCC